MARGGVWWFVVLVAVEFCFANDSSDISECIINDNCNSDRVCANQRCVDPCDGVCGPHTVCHVTNHVVMCSCMPGHSGHPVIGCSSSKDIPGHPSCSGHDQCPASKACIQGKCDDPCDGLCGDNTTCTVRHHTAACACKEGHYGDPFLGCVYQATPRRPSCSGHDQCPASKACIQGKCDDPCDGLCGDNTFCSVRHLTAACACKEGYVGDPFQGCVSQECYESWPPPSCEREKKFLVDIGQGVTWYKAMEACSLQGKRLGRIESEQESEKLRQQINDKGNNKTHFYWIAANDLASEGRFVWLGGHPLSYTNWADGEPDDKRLVYNELAIGADCVVVEVSSGMRWFDVSCFSTPIGGDGYICEYY